MADIKLRETKISGEEIFNGKIIKVRVDQVMLPNKKTATREVVAHPGAVGIVPITAQGDIILVSQFRYPVGEELLEIPAGKLDAGEEPLSCAKRELLEETGYEAARVAKIVDFCTTPGFSDEVIHLFLAEELLQVGQKLDEDEFLNIEQMPLIQARQLIFSGKIRDGKTIVGILAAMDILQQR